MAEEFTGILTDGFEYGPVFSFEAIKNRQDPIVLVILKLDSGDMKLVDRAIPLNPQKTYDALALLDKPDDIGVRINPWKGQATISQVTVSVLDKDQIFSQLLSDTFVMNREVEIKIGFLGMQEVDFLTAYTGKIKTYSWPRPGNVVFQVTDTQADMIGKVPEEASGATVVNTAFWNLPNVPDFVVASAVDGSTPQIFTITQSFDTTNLIRRTLLGHVSASTKRMYQIEGLTIGNTFSTWDVKSSTPLADGLTNANSAELLGDQIVDVMLNLMKRVDVPDSQINVASFLDVRSRFLPPKSRVRRILGKPKRAIDLLSELGEISLVTVFPDHDNRLSPKFFAPPAPHDDVFAVDDGDFHPVGGIGMTPNFNEWSNRIVIFSDHDGSQDEKTENFARADLFVDADSQENHKETRSRPPIRSLWLNSIVTNSAHWGFIGSRLLKRLSNPPRVIRGKVMLDAAARNVADIIEVTHPEVPGQPVGIKSPGITGELWQIVDKRVNASGGEVPLVLIDTRLDKNPMWIAHSIQPDYATATGIDRRHWYIGNSIGNFVNAGGDEGYFIQ